MSFRGCFSGWELWPSDAQRALRSEMGFQLWVTTVASFSLALRLTGPPGWVARASRGPRGGPVGWPQTRRSAFAGAVRPGEPAWGFLGGGGEGHRSFPRGERK